MSEEKSSQSERKSSRAFDAFAVRNDKDGKGHFHKIGAAFAHKDGQGYDIDTVAMPTNGRITLRKPQERLQETRSPQGRQERGRNEHDRG